MLTADMARRMEEEHAVVDRLARGLREWVAVVPRANFAHWIDGARQRFEHFRAHLIRHFSQEEHDGYVKSLAEQQPSLAMEIERLVHEHRELVQLLDAVHRDLQALTAIDRLLVQDVCRRMESFLGILEHHEHEEHLLTVFASVGPTSG